jgi:hypothetical protein
LRISEEEYRALIGTPPKKSKYKNNKPEYYDPDLKELIKFDSNKERDYYLILKDRAKRGEIRHLNRQYEIEIQPAFTDKQGNKNRAITYKADFYFYDKIVKSWRVVDVKGFKTEVYKLKKKLLAYKGVYIEEV